MILRRLVNHRRSNVSDEVRRFVCPSFVSFAVASGILGGCGALQVSLEPTPSPTAAFVWEPPPPTLVAVTALLATQPSQPAIAATATPTVQPSQPAIATAPPSPGSTALATPSGQSPAAGICADPSKGDLAVFVFRPDLPDPRCGVARPEQRLQVVNDTEQTIQVKIAQYEAQVEPGATYVFEAPLGSFLAPGVHDLWASAPSPELWLIGLATPVAQLPTAGICSDPSEGEIAVFTIRPDIPDPRCGKVRPEQWLQVINDTGQSIQARIGQFEAQVEPGASHGFEPRVYLFLAPGVHQLWTSAHSPEVWVVGQN